MARPSLRCPTCNMVVEARGPGELTASDNLTGHVLSVRRFFRGECPQHGWFDIETRGNHVTFWNWRFNIDFPKGVRRELISKLPPDESRRFKEMLEGRRRTDWAWLSTIASR